MKTRTLIPLSSIALVLPLLAGLATSATAAETPTCDGKPATIVANPQEDTFGTPGDDVIVGTEGWDHINGRGGNDTICGLGGADTLIGGTGDDRIFGGMDMDDYVPGEGYSGDTIFPGPGNDHIDLGADPQVLELDEFETIDNPDTVSYAKATGPVRVNLSTLTATGQGNDTFAPVPAGYLAAIVGSAYDDSLIGGDADEVITGRGGRDEILGGRGNDTLSGGRGDDSIHGQMGDDIITGDQGYDALIGGAGHDEIEAGPGDHARGGAGNDTISLSLPSNRRVGATRTVLGGSGRNSVRLNWDGTERFNLRLRIDVPKGQVRIPARRVARIASVTHFNVSAWRARGLVTFVGGRANENFHPEAADRYRVRAFGRGGDDVLFGASGDDLLGGGIGRDTLVGREGHDVCRNGERVRSCESRR